MAERTPATKWDRYKLSGVTVTNKELGHGSYATVWELEYMGLKCAGKKIHNILVNKAMKSYTVRRFEEECRLLSEVRHPNIVQFLGVYVCEELDLPILVMEHLPSTLGSCIEKYGVLPQEISYSILYDIALGLCYLHSQTPPIIHRDLSSNNVLLSHSLTAKISDLGVARISNMSPLQVSHMTQTPGTPAFMPPEVMGANPNYNKSVDEFSYGVMTIHVLSGAWPEPQTGPTHKQHGILIPISEAKRREIFLLKIGNNHPLMDLILKCVDNDPGQRMNANEITERLAKMVSDHPQHFRSPLQMLQYINNKEEEAKALKEVGDERAALIRKKEEEFKTMKEETCKELEYAKNEEERLKMANTLEVEELQLQIEQLKAKLGAVMVENETVLKENATIITRLNGQMERNEKNERKVTEKFDQSLKEIISGYEISLIEERKRSQGLAEEIKKKEVKKKELQESMRRKIETLEIENGTCKASLRVEKKVSQRLSEEIKEKEKEMHELLESTTKYIRTLTSEKTELQISAAQVSTECERLKANNQMLEKQLEVMEAKINRCSIEIKEKEKLLQQNAIATSRASEQLTAAREFLVAKKQVRTNKITLISFSFPAMVGEGDGEGRETARDRERLFLHNKQPYPHTHTHTH